MKTMFAILALGTLVVAPPAFAQQWRRVQCQAAAYRGFQYAGSFVGTSWYFRNSNESNEARRIALRSATRFCEFTHRREGMISCTAMTNTCRTYRFN